MTIQTPIDPSVSRFTHGVNWLGLWTVYLKEVKRFVNVFTQTILAPIATTLLFLAVFALSLGRSGEIGGVPYAVFLVPGLTIMAMVQNAFANTSSSIIIGKLQGSIVDMLMPPLSAAELTIGYAGAGATRGVVVGIAVGVTLYLFAPFQIHDWGLVIFHGVAGSLMLSLLGIMGALWSEKFDHIAAVTNFVVTPFAFLSGTFYSIERLPPTAQLIAHFNPFFYMIDGFRAGFIGHADGSLPLGIAVMTAIDLALGLATYWMFATGYKLKA